MVRDQGSGRGRGRSVGKGTALEASRAGRRIIERPRLTRLLTESESRVMLLVAPAGYGKTTLARQWLAGKPHGWYQATPASSDVAALALGLASAVAEVVPGVGDHLRARLKTVGNASSDARSLASDLAIDLGSWPRDVRLVVDDYQLVSESNAAEMFIDQLVRETAVPLLVTSRLRPSWVTAKHLLYGDVLEVGRNVLAMTHEEAAEALSSTQEVPGLVALAEGWPAVIGLAALVPSPLHGNASEVPETLHEYFAEELYEAVDVQTRWRIAQLAIAPVIDDSVAKALFGDLGTSVLEAGYANGFLTKSATTFEMHPLVRQFLRLKLSEFESADVRATAELLARSYLASERWDEAASIAIEFDLIEDLLDVLASSLDAVLAEGRLTTMSRWLDAARRAAPATPVVRLAAIELDFRTGDWAAASGRAIQLARNIPTDSPLASRVFLRAGQMAHLDDRQQEALEFLTAAKEQARSSQDLRRALWGRFITLCDLEERAEAETALQEFEALPPLTTEDLLRAGHGRLQFAGRWGPLTDALRDVSSLVELVDESNDPLIRTGFLQTYGSALGLLARYDECRGVANRQLEEAQRYKLDWVLPHGLEMLAVAQTGERDFNGALKSIAHARRLAQAQGNLHTEVNGVVLTARIYLCRGAAQRAARMLDRRESRFTSPGMEGEYLSTHALALASISQTRRARALISESESVSNQLEAFVMREFARAIAALVECDRPSSKESVERALNAALDRGNFDAFVCSYRAFPELLRSLTDVKEIDAQPFKDLVACLDPNLAEKGGLRLPSRSLRSGDALTRREQEVMGLIRQGLTNKEIARALWISESTAKVHVQHVFEKMGVHSRTEAIAASLEQT
jgi:LuxR family maltose regulon positive regulatory protein